MTAPCGVCGRACEVSESGQVMPCSCINTPLGSFLRGAIADCVGLPSLEVLPEGSTCGACGANTRLQDYCSECEDYERDRKLCMDQDSDKDYRLGNNR